MPEGIQDIPKEVFCVNGGLIVQSIAVELCNGRSGHHDTFWIAMGENIESEGEASTEGGSQAVV